MATLVLSSVGTALGGPVGAAIGALIGQSFDQQLLGPRSRGPRLGDLSVQTSSYGTQIPRIYGTMRVAGSVIWATDLVEGAATTGAKGQPDTVYSYSVSFAVALSSRPIAGIGRIWADGKLIRDVDGIFKVPTTFRFHDGSESQAMDPLIGSIEGIAATPAYRGLALAVFENLELAEFGNRLPFLTFEVLADPGAPTLGEVLNDIGSGAIASGDPRTLAGYAAHGRSIRSAVEPLVSAFAVQLLEDGSQLRTPQGDVAAIDEDRELGASADDPAPRWKRTQLPAGQLPATLRLTYYDPSRDYQFGEARASVGDESGIEEQRDLPAVISADEAKAIAHQAVARAWAERDRLTLRLPPRHLGLQPGTILELPFSPKRWSVERCTLDGFAIISELRPAPAPTAAPALLSAEAGRLAQGGADAGEMTIALFEATPASAKSNEPALFLAASSTGRGWRSAAVEISVGAHRLAVRTPVRKSVLGRALSALRPDDSSIEIELVDRDQWLMRCDEQELAEGGNLALLGLELLQFGAAEPVAPGRFRLSDLRRGCAGTEWAIDDHETGDDFVLLEPGALRQILIPGWVPAKKIAARLLHGSQSSGCEAILRRSLKRKKDS